MTARLMDRQPPNAAARAPPARPRLRPALRPAGRADPGAGPRLRADLLGRDRRHAARGRRPGHARHRRRRRRSSAPASPACATALYLAQEHGIQATVLEANQRRLGLHQPQRRPGPERQRPAVPLAVDRALGPATTARRLDAEIRAGFERFKSAGRRDRLRCAATAATSTSRTAPRRWTFLRDEARVMNEHLRLRHAHARAATSCARDYVRRARGRRRAARGRGRRHPPAEVRLRLSAQGARARRAGAHRPARCKAGDVATACTTCARRAARCARARVAVCHRRLHRPAACTRC